uniref:Blastoderm-specific protein 25D n=1 Tax=Anopheles farauti TaxID=69004 RepID=A0A182QM03_9DIPT
MGSCSTPGKGSHTDSCGSSTSGFSSTSASPSFHGGGSKSSSSHKARSTAQRNTPAKNGHRKVETVAEQQTESAEKENISLLSVIGQAKPQFDMMKQECVDGVPVDDNEFMNQSHRVVKRECTGAGPLPEEELGESSDREVSPKFVVGTKKYGRRSRPREDVNGLDSSSLSSNSDNETVTTRPTVRKAANDENGGTSAAEQQQQQQQQPPHRQSVITGTGTVTSSKVQRSASQSDIHGSKRRRPVVGSGVNRLKRCASLPTHRQRPTAVESKRNTTTVTIREQLHMDDERIDQKIYFMNLSENLREIWNSLLLSCEQHHGDLLDQTQLEEVCERVGLQKVPARLAAQEVFNKLALQPTDGIGFDEFIALLESNTDLLPMSGTKELQLGDCGTTATASVVAPEENTFTLAMPPDWKSEIGSLAASIIIDMWESAGIEAPANLLQELGFDHDVIQVADLVQALEEEHQRLVTGHLNSSTISNISNPFDDAALIVRASLALHKAEVNALRQAFHQLVEENKKLYADNKEVNHRALLLAQEVDERHNSLENSTRTKIRQLEQRHHETVKELSSQLAFEREQLSHANAMLEQRIQALESEESKLKADMARMSEENEELRQDQENLTKEITDLLEKNIKLNRDIAELEENNRNDYADEDECGFVRKDSEEVLDLIDRISLLQSENTGLRDKNDELSVEIETLNVELNKFKLKRCPPVVDDLSAPIGEGPSSSAAVKRRGDSPSKTRLSDESPRLGKFRRCSNDNDVDSDASSGDWMALHSELGQSIRCTDDTGTMAAGCCAELTGASSGISSMNESSLCRDDEIKALRTKIEELEEKLRNTKASSAIGPGQQATAEENLATTPSAEVAAVSQDVAPAKDEECKKLKARCEELEASLEQMRKEYEDCEDYWQAKVNDERLLYEEEQRINDDKFTELLKKVAEYEEQFATHSKLEKDGRLSPIDEKDGLEQQYLELEADLEQAQLALEERTAEVEKLRHRIQEMEQMHKYPSEMLLSPSPRVETPEVEDRPASSPISYLWNQSTIQRPVRDYQNPNWRPSAPTNARSESSSLVEDSCSSIAVVALESEPRIEKEDGGILASGGSSSEVVLTSFDRVISPIQKPSTAAAAAANFGSTEHSATAREDVNRQCTTVAVLDQIDASDACSIKSTRSTHSLASTHSIQLSESSGGQMKQMRLMQLQLHDEIKDLTHERDCLMMELQQLKEAKSVLARSYAKTASHPNQLQKIQNLEQKNRHLQLMVKQQQQYTESILHQTWHQQRSEINDLRNRLEAQCIVISDQAARLANNDILVKDMYAENSQLMLQVQRLEHQCNRANWMQQYSQSNSSTGSHHGLSGIMPGLP